MHFLKRPNLPENNVKRMVCDSRILKEIRTELETNGINVLIVPASHNLQQPVSAHPDMHIFHAGDGNFYTTADYVHDFERQINSSHNDCCFFNNVVINDRLKSEYPHDVLLNGVTVGEYLICNPKTFSKEVLEMTKSKIIKVNQGYAKCSTCVVSEQAIITDDISIMNAVKSKLDVLYVDHGYVQLDGYNYGFIGGCCGKLSKNILAFCGDLKQCDCSSEIITFCRNHGVECISLSKYPLYDYGSIIPIIEE